MNIDSTENKICGNWIIEHGKPVADAISERIYYLINNVLIEIARSDDGWSVLYFDKNDGRYWELYYPDSNLNGGGAPCLEHISRNSAIEKYKISVK